MKSPDYSYQGLLERKIIAELLTRNRALLAACPGAGKTRMAINIIKYFRKSFPRSKILILTHGQILLREQWNRVLKETKANFKIKPITSIDQLNTKADVFLALPQTIRKVHKGEFDFVIIDEAHHYAEAEMVKRILAKVKPSYELRLTGTPSIYVDDPKWPIVGITIQELLTFGVLTDPGIELLRSEYDFQISDYTKNLELRAEVSLSAKATLPLVDSIVEKLGTKDKTIIICKNQQNARDVSACLNQKGISNIVSISDLNDGTAEVDAFKSQKCNFLVVVNRGTLGFDYDKLANIVDISGSLNVDRLFQTLCRVIRRDLDHPRKKKRYLKVATDDTVFATQFIMSFVVALSDPGFYFTYRRNQTRVRHVPVSNYFLDTLRKVKIGEYVIPKQYEDLPTLFTFEDIKNIKNGTLTTYGTTTFERVRRLLARQTDFSVEKVLALAASCKTRIEFKTKYRSAYAFLWKNNLLLELDKILPRQKTIREWTIEDAVALGKQFKNLSSFRVKHHGAYKFLKRQNALHLLGFQKINYKAWTVDTAVAEMRRYSTQRQFRKNAPGAEKLLVRSGIKIEFPSRQERK